MNELTGAALDAAVAEAEGYAKVTRMRTQRVIYEDGWGRSTPSMPPQWKTTALEEWTKWPNDPAAVGWPDPPRYSTEWSVGGPIIEREHIELTPSYFYGDDDERSLFAGYWEARLDAHFAKGPTPLIAAMRAYAASTSPGATKHRHEGSTAG